MMPHADDTSRGAGPTTDCPRPLILPTARAGGTHGLETRGEAPWPRLAAADRRRFHDAVEIAAYSAAVTRATMAYGVGCTSCTAAAEHETMGAGAPKR